MKTKTIKSKCGGKSSGCCADIILPYGSPKQVTDNLVGQRQSK